MLLANKVNFTYISGFYFFFSTLALNHQYFVAFCVCIAPSTFCLPNSTIIFFSPISIFSNHQECQAVHGFLSLTVTQKLSANQCFYRVHLVCLFFLRNHGSALCSIQKLLFQQFFLVFESCWFFFFFFFDSRGIQLLLLQMA